MAKPIAITALHRITPSNWSHLRLCRLRGLLAATPSVNDWILHNPRAWLGTAFHKVMECVHRGLPASAIEAEWNTAIQRALDAAAAHPLDSRYARPERWPGYFLVRQRALASAAAIAARQYRISQDRAAAQRKENLLRAKDGKLVGRPDRYDRRSITDFKSTLPDTAWKGAAAVIEGFQRQIRLYAVLIAESEGYWPAHGNVVAASGQTLTFPIAPTECEREAV